MKKILALVSTTISITFSQSVYDVEQGTKGNRIKLTVSNISEINQAEGVEVKLVKSSSSLSFTKETETIELLNPKKETEALFSFDINTNAPVNQRDTVEFMITDKNELSVMKSFILNYTGPKEFKHEQNYPNPFNFTTRQ